MSGSKFEIPSWASPPSGTLRFDVMKDGVKIDTVDMGKKKCFRVGRQEENDLVLDHLSISRQHAAIVHGTENSKHGATLFDLDSAHGTVRINAFGKEKLKPNEGIALKEGDVVVFGASTRQYQVAGINANTSKGRTRSRSPMRRKSSRSRSPKWKGKPIVPSVPAFVSPAQFRQSLATGVVKTFAKGGVLAPDTDQTSEEDGGHAGGERRKPASAQWKESAATEFAGDELRKEKFLKLMGGKKGSATTGFEKRLKEL